MHNAWKRMMVGSGTPWEAAVGYSRAVRVGPFVHVAGTVAADERGQIVAPGDGYQQTAFILRKIAAALEQAGARMENVVRTRMYVTSMDHMEAVGRAHREVFGSIRPVATMVEVARLAGEGAAVEIEVEAIVTSGAD